MGEESAPDSKKEKKEKWNQTTLERPSGKGEGKKKSSY